MCNAARESDVIYNEAMKVKLAQPDASQYDLIYLIKDWRKIFHLTHHFNMHEMASKQAHTAVTLFRASNEEKHDRRKKHKHQVRTGKRKKYVRNKWTEPTSLYRKLRQDGRLHTVVTRETPKLNDNGTLRLPGFGTVRVCSSMPDGIIKSFQLVDDTNKITKRTTSYDRKFKLHVQVEIPDKPPLEGKYAGMDRGIKCLVAVSDSHGNQRLHNIPDSCRRSKNDKIGKRSPLRSDSMPDLPRLITNRATFSAVNAHLIGIILGFFRAGRRVRPSYVLADPVIGFAKWPFLARPGR